MGSSTLFIILLVGLPLLMMLMHRGGHSGMGCGMGHTGQNGHEHGDDARQANTGEQGKKPLLGPPGTANGAPAPVVSEEHRHRGC